MPLTIYKCSKCKSTHNDFGDADKCEKSHLPVTSVREMEYLYSPYPMRLMVSFPDGREREYVLEA